MRGLLYGVLVFSLAFTASGWDSKISNENIPKNSTAKVVQNTQKTGKVVKPAKVVKPSEKVKVTDLKVTIGKETFNIKLLDNKTAKAFVEQLPMTIDMSEMNGNEKYYYLSKILPTASEQPGEIKAGDLMIFGNDCLVLFYENFSSAYSYTRIGTIEDPAGLAEALGEKNCKVTFDVVKKIKIRGELK